MKKILDALAMTQTMFCAVPMPFSLWNEDARPLMPAFMPLVGLEIGALWYAAARLAGNFALPPMVTALILTALPHLVTGFLHLDGFMDVTDAVKSCRSRERQLEILKDSRVGAFAVIGCVLLFLSEFALFASLPQHAGLHTLIFVPVVSRCCAALAVVLLRPLKVSQYAGGLHGNTKLVPALVFVQLAVCYALCGVFCAKYIVCLAVQTAVFWLCVRRCVHSLGGMNGDIAGYSITLSELAAIAVLAVL